MGANKGSLFVKFLNKRQEDFCYYYATIGHGYESVIKAGYSEKSPKQQASRLLTNANLERKIESKNIIHELFKIALSNIGDFVEVNKHGKFFLLQIQKLIKNLSQ